MNLLRRIVRPSLRTKFLLPITALLAVSISIVSVYLLDRQADSYRRELETSGETMIKMLAISAESGVLFEAEYMLDELLQALDPFEMVNCVEITNLEGKQLSTNGYCNLMHGDALIKEIGYASGSLETRKAYYTDSTGAERLLLMTPVITHNEDINRENLGMAGQADPRGPAPGTVEVIGFIQICFSLDNVNMAIAEGRLAVILLSALILIICIVTVIFIVNAITRPLTELVGITDKVRQGDLSRRVEIDQDDEIGHLARTFNSMIESLQQSREEIEEYNRTLEEKIEERTGQLEDAQAQLIQSEKMSAIGQLAAGVAHELNNPLGGILGYAQFTIEKLRKHVPNETGSKQIDSYLKYVRDIETQAKRCKAIVQNLLKFSRSSRSIDFEDVNLNTVITETISFVEHQLKIAQIDLEVKLAEKIPNIRGNIGQLQQVFTNLIINAMHASEPGSKIQILSRFSPSLGEFGGAVELDFVDYGHGVSPENLQKIFEPFFTTKEIGHGTGLGLSVSYGIIRDHAGEIQIQSEIGKGTTFTIVLPVQKPAKPADIPTE